MLKFNVMDLFEGRVAPEVERTFRPVKEALTPSTKAAAEPQGVEDPKGK
tara:strand:- start:95 stop:241 length:147 start_codon:yes stop_codon:yes gene_type:complete